MATPNYTEEEILFRRRARRRLVGAVVLVVSVVAIVPMILPESKPQSETQQIEIRIPAQDASGYAPKIVAAPDTSVVDATPAVTASTPASDKPEERPPAIEPKIPSAAPVENAKETTAPVVAPAKAPVVASAKPVEAAKANAAVKQAYFVQYGAFSELKNAKQRQADLKGKGINTHTEVVKTSAGDKIRVRSGPYTAREDAEKIRTKVKPLDSKLVVMGDNQ